MDMNALTCVGHPKPSLNIHPSSNNSTSRDVHPNDTPVRCNRDSCMNSNEKPPKPVRPNDPESKNDQTMTKADAKDTYWQAVWRSTGQELGVSGLRYATSKTEPVARRVLWSVLIICGLSFMTYQIAESFQEYFKRSASTAINDIFPAKLRFPILTICNENKFMRTKAKALGLEATIENLNPPWFDENHTPTPNTTAARVELAEAYSNFGFTSEEEFWRNMSYSYDDLFVGCQFTGKKCDASWFEEVWTDQGLCYQFKPASHEVMVERAGSGNGLSLLLNADQEEYINMMDYAAGFRIKASELGEFVSMSYDATRVSPGYYTSVRIHQTTTILLEPPFGNCSNSRKLRRFPKYSRFHCDLEYLIDFLVDTCGCRDPSWPAIGKERTCTLDEVTSCIESNYSRYLFRWQLQPSPCEQECVYTTYDLIYSSNVLAKYFINYLHYNVSQGLYSKEGIAHNFAVVSVYFPKLSFTRMESQVAYSITMLFNDLGGALGLMLGSLPFTRFLISSSGLAC